MIVTAITYFGEKITVRNKTKAKALEILAKNGVTEDMIHKLEVRA